MMLVQKYQPKKFRDYIGHEGVNLVRDIALTGQSGHNFLFKGVYGSGKTSLARTYAISRRCASFMKRGDLCGQCEACNAFLDNRSTDEWDLWTKVKASSLRAPDDVYATFEKYMPNQTFFIDEIQVLDHEIQTALIEKTDAMIGSYGACIFATTQPEKVLAPLRSRCLRIDFHLVPDDVLFQHVKRIAVSESIGIDDRALMCVVDSAQGHVRDAVNHLETISKGAKGATIAHIDEAYVLARLGYSDDGLMLEMITEILENRDFSRQFKKLASHQALDFPIIAWRVVGQILRSQTDPTIQASYRDVFKKYGRKVWTLVDHVSSKDFEIFDDLRQLYLRLEFMRYAVGETPP